MDVSFSWFTDKVPSTLSAWRCEGWHLVYGSQKIPLSRIDDVQSIANCDRRHANVGLHRCDNYSLILESKSTNLNLTVSPQLLPPLCKVSRSLYFTKTVCNVRYFAALIILQGSVATPFRFVGNLIIILLQIFCLVRRWKNFENWLISGKDMDKCHVSFTHGV